MHIHFDLYAATPKVSPVNPGDDYILVKMGDYVRMGLSREEAERFAKDLQAAASQLPPSLPVG